MSDTIENANELTIKEMRSGLYCIIEYTISTMYLVVGSERALLIDCGTGIFDLRTLVESITNKPYDVVCTHAHIDHIGGRGQFPAIHLHTDDVSIVHKATHRFRRTLPLFARNRPIHLIRKIKKIDNEPTIIAIEEGHVFNLGDKHIKVYHSKGHTLGSISLLLVEDRLLFTGDNCNPLLFMWLPHTSTMSEYIATLRQILLIDGYDSIVQSHYSEIAGKEQISKNIIAASILNSRKKSKLFLIKTFKYQNVTIIYRTTCCITVKNQQR